MNKVLLVLFTVILFVASCGETEVLSDPNIVAEKFLKEYIGLNYEKAKTFATAEYGGILDQYQSEKALLTEDIIKESENATVEIKNMDIREAEGVAYAKFSNSQLPDIIDQLELKKVDNKWLVNNVERTVDMELDNKFPDDEIEKMMEEAEETEEAPVEVIE